MEVIRQFTISSAIDLLGLDIIDFNRLNGVWKDPGEAMNTILSWFDGVAIATEVKVHDYFNAPMRDDFPGWKHIGTHEKIGRYYWNWFWWHHENGNLYFSDAPDFYGNLEDGSRFWGDIGKISASAFARTQKQMRDHDIWVTLKGDGSRQVVIEPKINILEKYGEMYSKPLLGGSLTKHTSK